MRRRSLAACLVLPVAALALALPLTAQQRPASGPAARYDMRAGTVSGMGVMAAMNPMAMMFGGGRQNQPQHELLLRLGTDRAPDKGLPGPTTSCRRR